MPWEAPASLRPDCNAMHEFAGGIRNSVPSLAHILDRQQDCLASVCQRLFGSLSLTVATWKCRYDCDVTALRVWFEHDVIARLFHALSLSR